MNAYQYTAANGRTLPEMPEIIQLIERSENPDVRQRDPRPVQYLANRAINRNPRLRGFIRVRRTALSAFSWDITPHDPADEDRADEAARRNAATIAQIIATHVRTPLYGGRIIQLSPTMGEDGWTMEWAGLNHITSAEFSRSRVRIFDDSLTLKTIETIYNTTNDPAYNRIIETDAEDEGNATTSILIYEALRLKALSDWSNLSRLLKGLIHVTDGGSTDEESAEAEKAARNALAGGFVKTSDLIQFNFGKIADAAGGKSIGEFVEYLEKSLAIQLLGQANTTEMPRNGGSRAGLQVMQSVSADIMWDDMQRVERSINRLLELDWRYNYGSATPPYQFKFSEHEHSNPEVNAIMVREALNTALQFKTAEIYDKLGFTPPEGAPDIISGMGGI